MAKAAGDPRRLPLSARTRPAISDEGAGRPRTLRGWAALAILAGAVLLFNSIWADRALAVCAPQEGPRFTAAIADRFVQNPSKLLGRDTSDYGLTVFVMQFAAARPRNLDVFKPLLLGADRNQRTAIGLGFARAVTFCRLADGAISERIADWVSKLPARDVVSAYRQAMSLSDPSDSSGPAGLAAPQVEDRFGAGLELMHPPSAAGVGNLDIPDPTRLPGD